MIFLPQVIVERHRYNATNGDLSREEMIGIDFDWRKTRESLMRALKAAK